VDERIIVWDDQSASRMWDFCLVDGARMHGGSLEVTRHTDPGRRKFQLALEKYGLTWDASEHLTSNWMVQLRHSVQLNSEANRRRVFDFLAALERAGVDRVVGRTSTEAHDAGIYVAVRRTDTPRGSISVLSEGAGWFGDGYVAKGVIEEAEGNRDKLMAAPPPRHLFVWIDWAALAATFEMTDGREPPTDPVDLPDYVDVAWAACGEANLEGAALWHVERGRPWTVVRPFSQ
jgi:hypothetical protein